VFVGKSKAFRMVAALVDRCREEVVLLRKRTREASIIGFGPLGCGSGSWRRSGAKFHMLRTEVADPWYRINYISR